MDDPVDLKRKTANRRAMRSAIKAIPALDRVLAKAVRPFLPRPQFRSSAQYWEDRYRLRGDSGDGSYGRLAQFKADVINAFVKEQSIASVFELGCGDGAQLQLAQYPRYAGVDVATAIIEKCRRDYAHDSRKCFYHVDELPAEMGVFDLSLSLDVIYHLVEDATFEAYMRKLFAHSAGWVIIYSSNVDRTTGMSHVRHRKFSDWIDAHLSGWVLDRKIEQKYPFDWKQAHRTSFADFYIYRHVHAGSV